MAIDVLQFMDKQNAYVLADALLAKTNIRLGERIVKELDATSSNKQLPSARLAYKLISSLQNVDVDETNRTDVQDSLINKHTADIKVLQDSQPGQDEKLTNIETKLSETTALSEELTHFTIETVNGDISQVTDPQTDVMYLQRDNESDKTWMIYLYIKSVNPNYVEYDPTKYFTTDGTGVITGLTADGLATTELIIPTEIAGVAITGVADSVFDTAVLTHVKFMGTEDEWNTITIGTTGNDSLVNATKEYDYELEPETIDSWINIGDTEVDLSVIWSKDEVEELKEALGVHNTEAIPEDRISAIIDAEFDATAVDFRVYKMIENKPSTTNTSLIYTGADQTPIWDNYDPTKVDISGDISATELGNYNTTFTPKDGYKWNDNTVDPVTIQWTIITE